MKNLFKSFVVGALLLGSVGCSDMFKEDLYEINNEIDKINQRIDSLCNAVNTNIASLQTIIDVMQDNDYVDSITPIVEGGETVGYEIVFTQSGSVKIYHGKKGDTGATGHSPVVGVKQAEDGRWYWTIDGEWMVNAEGEKILAEAIDGEDGAPGADGIPGIDGITPKLKVQDNYWYISYDNGTTWERLGKATGEAGADGDSMFQSVNYNEDYVELVLVDGTVLTIPTWASHMLLVDEIAKINNNISALQAAVKALESNDYVQKVTPVKDEEGNVVGYTLQFAFAGDVTIYHGEDGEKGEDGHTPVIGVRQFEGEWYWTIDNEWLLDEKGNKVPTSGEDGAEGAEGQAGITPELKIEDDYWYVSYDKGGSWTNLGKAKGEDGAAGGDGAAGDAFFEDVDTSDEYYIILTLADGTEIKIPTWKAHQALADAVSHLNTNVTSLQAIITGIQNNDFVTGTTEIVDPQTNEVIGYKLHFSKSGDIEIYHGKTPNAPEIGIKKHPQYGLCWTYDGEYIKDPSTGKPVALPQDGADAVAPKFKIEDGRWWMSTDGGRSWEDIGQATGDQGQQGETGATGGSGDSFFKSIVPEYATDANGNVLKDTYGKPIVAYIVMTLAGDNDGEDVVYKVPTEYITDELTKRIADLENQFKTINNLISALLNVEYIEKVDRNENGIAITFIKYKSDGTVDPESRHTVTVNNGTGGAAGTVVDAEYDENTGIWYWTLDGKRIPDGKGGYLAITGNDGKPGITPEIQINPETNEWEVSYDGGTTWESTGVEATGPQGPVGPQGPSGSQGTMGDPYFKRVYLSEDKMYWIFERTEGEEIMVPTIDAFMELWKTVNSLNTNVESLQTAIEALENNDYVTSVTPMEDGSGYVINFSKSGSITILNGEGGSTPTITIENGYWVINGVPTTVRAEAKDGTPGVTPTFTIKDGMWYVSYDNGQTWSEEPLGPATGPQGPTGGEGVAGDAFFLEVIPLDANGEEGDNLTMNDAYYIKLVLVDSTPENSEDNPHYIIPTKKATDAITLAVDKLNSNVEALQTAVRALEENDFVTGVTPITEGDKEIGYTITFSKSGTVKIYHGNDGNTPTVEISEDGYWVINGNKTNEKAVPADGKTPLFKIVNGKWYYSYTMNNMNDSDVEGWTEAGQATGPQGPQGPTGGEGVAGDAFFLDVLPLDQNGNTGSDVTYENAYYIKIILVDGTENNMEDNPYYIIPTKKETDRIAGLVSTLNQDIEALKTTVNAINAKQHIISWEIEYAEDGTTPIGYKLTLTDGPDKDDANDVMIIKHGSKGDQGDQGIQGTTPTITISEDGYWVINGTTTDYIAVGKNGDTPLFKIVNGMWYYSYTMDNVDDDEIEGWTEAGQATGPVGPEGPEGPVGSKGDAFFKDVNEMTYDENGKIVTAEADDIVYFIQIVLNDEDDNDESNKSYLIPTKAETDRIAGLVSTLNQDIEALKATVNAINAKQHIISWEIEYAEDTPIGYKLTLTDGPDDGDANDVMIIKHGSKGDQGDQGIQGTTPTITISEDGYWVINGTPTDYIAVGKNGDTPLFKIVNGMWYYSYTMDNVDDDEIEGWTEAGQATGSVGPQGPQGPQGDPGTNGDAFFKAVNEMTYDEDGKIIAAEADDIVYFIQIVLSDGDDNDENNRSYLIPTQAETDRIAGLVSTLNQDIEALKATVNAINAKQHIISWEIEYAEDRTTPIGYKLTLTDGPDEGDANDVMTILHGSKGDKGDQGIQGTTPTITISEDGYWVINGTPTDYIAVGKNGDTPLFKIVNGMWYYSYTMDNIEDDKTEGWTEAGQATGDKGETGSAGSDGDAFFDAVNEMTYDADGNIVAAGERDTVYFIEIVLTDGDDDDDNNKSYLIPTKAETDRIATVLEELTSDYIALKNALNNTMFITGMEAITPTETDSRGGYKLFYKTFKDGSMTDATEPLYVYDGITPNAPVLGVGSVEVEGVTKYYWTVNRVALDADLKTEGIQYVYTTGENGKTPELGFSVVDGNLIITVDGTEVLKAAVKGEQGTSGLEIVPNEDGTTVSIYHDKNGDGKIDKSDESTELLTTVPKWFNEPSVTFTEGVTNDKVTGATTVKFKVTGSFVNKPEVYAACEGNWSSGVVTVGDLNEGKTEVICSVTVNPTTAYVGDSTLGKLTIYVPYYGKTTIKQVELSASGSTGLELQSMPILPKDAEDTKATVSFTLDEGENAPSSNGSCTLVYDFGYTLTDIQTTTDGKEVEAGNGFSSSVGGNGWLSTGAYRYDSSTKKITQEINIEPYTDLKATSPRVAAVIVYSPSGREVSRFIIKQDKVNVINLAEEESANCYIISEPGYYKFPVVKGNKNTRVVNGGGLTKDSFDDAHINGGNNPIDIVAYDDNYVYFKVDAASITPGNSLITVKDGSNIAWSWHLWFQQPGNRADVSTTWNKYPTTEADVMNRALGATHFSGDENSTFATVVEALAALGYSVNIWDDGLYYQWGRKDPLTGTNVAEGTGSYDSSVQNPQILYKEWNAAEAGWGKGKSVNDPCPPGYRVPSTGIWREINSSTDLEDIISRFPNFGYPYNLQYNAGLAVNIVYPYLNYLINGALAQAETIPFPNTNETKRRTKSQSAGSFEIKIKYAGYDYSKFGELWANNGALKYGEVGTTVTEADVFVYFNKQWYPSNPDESDDGWTVGNIKDALLSNITNRTIKYLLQIALRVVDPDEIAMNILNSLTTKEHITEIRNTDENPIPLSNAAHVRCVSDNSPIK